jgi:hypothetical protein
MKNKIINIIAVVVFFSPVIIFTTIGLYYSNNWHLIMILGLITQLGLGATLQMKSKSTAV